MAFGIIEFDTIKETFNVAVAKKHAKNIQEKIQSLLLNTNKNDTVQSENSGADEIRKYKELLDEGIIEEAEFNKMKKEILGI